MDIYLKHAILHIIDRQTGNPVFSQVELDLTTEYIRDYLTKKYRNLQHRKPKQGVYSKHQRSLNWSNKHRMILSQPVKRSSNGGMKPTRKVKMHQVRMPLSSCMNLIQECSWHF